MKISELLGALIGVASFTILLNKQKTSLQNSGINICSEIDHKTYVPSIHVNKILSTLKST